MIKSRNLSMRKLRKLTCRLEHLQSWKIKNSISEWSNQCKITTSKSVQKSNNPKEWLVSPKKIVPQSIISFTAKGGINLERQIYQHSNQWILPEKTWLLLNPIVEKWGLRRWASQKKWTSMIWFKTSFGVTYDRSEPVFIRWVKTRCTIIWWARPKVSWTSVAPCLRPNKGSFLQSSQSNHKHSNACRLLGSML